MKELIRQFYNEGLATTFVLKPYKFIDKHIKNKFFNKLFKVLIILFYTLLALSIAAYYLYSKLK